MGIEYYIQGYWKGEDSRVLKSDVLRVFGKTASDEGAYGFFPLHYDERNTCNLTISEENDLVTGMCIHRPCAHPALYQSIFECLQSGPFVLFVPGGNAPIVAQQKVTKRLPLDMIESLGEPVLVFRSEDIQRTLFG
ncbi:hypothetical protein [Aliiroseovarius sp. S253]|uniref:hypothetical protein n=1 Tax=Aliiroseovarius sp. S253 TaxID=3415133 RepID=UPI003C7A3DE6